jgi:hypothetical protein
VDSSLWRCQDHLCDFALGFTETIQIFSDFFQRVHDDISLFLSAARQSLVMTTD